jgi:hypothetical protein
MAGSSPAKEKSCEVAPLRRCQQTGGNKDGEETAMPGIFANRWWVVAATVLGLIVGAGPINVFTFGVFLKPVTAELGIGRGLLSSALTLQ